MALGDDPRGGLDKISAASAAHNSDDDNRRLKALFDEYTTGAKGSNGLPNGERMVEKWNAQLASREALSLWVELSEGAKDKFMVDNFDKSWKLYDQYDRGNIDMLSVVPFIRDLMSSLSSSTSASSGNVDFNNSPEPNTVVKLDVEPIVEPDLQPITNSGAVPSSTNAPLAANDSTSNDSLALDPNAPSTNPNAAQGTAVPPNTNSTVAQASNNSAASAPAGTGNATNTGGAPGANANG